MKRLIDKDALVAEIENIRKHYIERDDFDNGWNFALDKIISFIDTHEVREVDLDSDIRTYLTNHFNIYEDGILQSKKSGLPLSTYDIINVAKHFFELGLKAQHDNWKVVDDVNQPQPDKNKIYCVLSRDKYLLARVIEHPQDEELLQWKCTEFPHHRYDMCEGDKYMQIV